MKILYLDAGMGAAGDMLMGALSEVAPEEAVQKVQNLGIDTVSVTLERGEKCGVGGTHARVLVDGEDMNGEKVNKKLIRQKVGLVFQYPEYQLFEETVAKDIAFGPKNQGLSEEEIDCRVRKAMARVQLDYGKYAERSPFELSGGQMRRVAIAGVLAMEPRYLILDEPAAGLDPKGRDRILGMVKDLHEAGVTVVMVSHSMDDCARLASRMIVMSKGTVVASDTPRNLFAQPEMMASVGLGVPEAAKLCAMLREKGLNLPNDLYTQEELQEHILRLWKEVHHA
jgi:energy-coupling factor transport system ATP-binding protein